MHMVKCLMSNDNSETLEKKSSKYAGSQNPKKLTNPNNFFGRKAQLNNYKVDERSLGLYTIYNYDRHNMFMKRRCSKN